MKKILAIFAFALLLVGCGSQEQKATNASNTIKVGVSADYPPFEFINDQNEITGFDIELIKTIGKKVGFDVQIVNMSFDGVIPALKAGKIDAIISAMSATEERKQSIDFTDSYYSTENLFIRKKGSNVSENSLKSSSIGVQLGSVQEMVANKIEGAKVVPSDNPLTAIMGLKNGKVDVVLVDSSIGYGYLKQNEDLEEFLTLPDGSEGFSIAFDKNKHTDLISKINSTLKELKENGTITQIAKKYNLK